MTQKTIPELLAPGGSIEGIKGAVNAGADAVYVGGSRFGARAYAENPDDGALIDMIDFCHIHGRKLYLTVNTLLKEEELTKSLYAYMQPLYEAGVDAVLVQDPGVLRFLRREFPDLPLHASTQMSVQSPAGAAFLQKLGITRIVPARELTLTQIREIYDHTQMEIECFIHGAMCYCYSGQCLLSSLIGGRSGNRGRCAQPCRLLYDLYDEQHRRLNQKGQNSLLSLKDICALELLPELADAGVCSLKIEGRMKKPEYAAGVTSIYRQYLDMLAESGRDGYRVKDGDMRILRELFSRGEFSRGYYEGKTGRQMMDERPKDREGQTASSARDEALFAGIREKYLKNEIKEKIKGKFILRQNKEAILSAAFSRGGFTAGVSLGGAEAQEAKSASVQAGDIRKQLQKTGNTPFAFSELEIDCDDGLFIPMGEISRMRREALEALQQKILENDRRKLPDRPTDSAPVCADRRARTAPPALADVPAVSCFAETLQQMEALAGLSGISILYLDAAWWLDRRQIFSEHTLLKRCRDAGQQVMLALPPIWQGSTPAAFYRTFDEQTRSEFDGFLLRCFDQLGERGKICTDPEQRLCTDSSIYAWNREAAVFLEEYGVSGITLSVEENVRELAALSGAGPEKEMIIYGYLPVMTTRNCLMKNTCGCAHKPGVISLRDRTGAFFPVRLHCGLCGNVIYNSLPLSLLDAPELLRAAAPDRVRLHFTIEEPAQCASLAGEAAGIVAAAFGGSGGKSVRAGGTGASAALSGAGRTHGHSRRGVL